MLCRGCKQEKSDTDFYANKSSCTGRVYRCKSCFESKRKETREKSVEKYRKRELAYYWRNRDKIKPAMKERARIYAKTETPEKRKARLSYNREYIKRVKLEVMRAYSGGKDPVCVCCGEEDITTLCLDHVLNDGKIHREKVRSSMYNHLIANGFPMDPASQVLCMNCNISKQSNYGVMPEWRRNKYRPFQYEP